MAGGGAAAAAAVVLAAAEKNVSHAHACMMLASVLWGRTSICWYWFAVSGDVLTNLLALQHRVHHHSSNNCKTKWPKCTRKWIGGLKRERENTHNFYICTSLSGFRSSRPHGRPCSSTRPFSPFHGIHIKPDD